MTVALAAFSVLIIAMSIYGVVQPAKLTALVRHFMISPGVWGAVAIRLLLAGLLWFSAPFSHTPLTFKVLALLTFLAAIALPMIGAARLMKFVDYLASWPPTAIRVQCLLGIALGAFLLWSLSHGLGAG
ncbi:MAG: hypothetical protein AAGA21_21230 [Pseudomonadota bacterium]